MAVKVKPKLRYDDFTVPRFEEWQKLHDSAKMKERKEQV